MTLQVILKHYACFFSDCHAEIVSRRCLLSFFYSQLEKFANSENENENIFEPLESGGYKLRREYRFHLYINTAPCGDARIFSPHEAEPEVTANASNPATAASDPHPNRKARGQLRTKIESGEGTIPVKSSDGIQTWDGVLQGSRLLTMSCSGNFKRKNRQNYLIWSLILIFKIGCVFCLGEVAYLFVY